MRYTLIFIISLLFTLSACDPKEKKTSCTSTADLAMVLDKISTDYILPNYQDFETELLALQSSVNQFELSPTESNLENLQAALKSTYLQWQVVAAFEFGPAETMFFRTVANSYPTKTDIIQTNITDENYNLDAASNVFARGLPALDYMLHGVGASNTEIMTWYNDATDGAKRIAYLSALVDDLWTKSEFITSEWLTTYKSEFDDNAGVATGSSISNVVNQLNENFEIIKRDKIGIPSGVLAFGNTSPNAVEALYAGYSTELAIRATIATREFYEAGLSEYVLGVTNGAALNTRIQNNLIEAKAALELITNPLQQAVDNQNTEVVTAYNELTEVLLPMKTDMPSQLCIAITYIDNPSDSD